MHASELLSFPVIRTQRLVLRQMVLSDADAVFAFKSDPEVTAMYGQEPHGTVEQTKGWIESNMLGFTQRASYMWSITLQGSDTVIGGCCFWNIDQGSMHAEIGYELGKDHWGKGFAREALEGLLDYGFGDLGFHRVEACPLSRNERSIRLLKSLGFRFEGTFTERILYEGKYLDQMNFALLSRDWLKIA
jgi:ribosomal-protein-alanine N-acetyltransferase